MTGKQQDRMPETARRAADAGPLPDASALFSDLQQQLQARPKRTPLAELSTPRRLALSVGAAGLIGLSGIRDLEKVGDSLTQVCAAIYFTAALWLITAALRPFQQPAFGPGGLLLRVFAAATVAVGLALLPSLLTAAIPAPPKAALACLAMGTVYSLPVFLLLRWLDRGQRLGPWFAALSAGLVGNVWLQVHCPADDAAHRLIGHALVLATTSVVAWVAIVRARSRR